jgi:hypothetical protein
MQGLLKKYGRGRYETVPSELDRLEAIAQAAQAQAQAEAAAAAAKQQAAETLAAAEPQEVAAPITPFQATVYAAIKVELVWAFTSQLHNTFVLQELIPAAMAKAPAPHYVTEAALAVLAGVDGAGTSLKAGKAEGRALARALVEAGVLAADATGPKGRAVVIKGEAAEALYAEAVAALEAYVSATLLMFTYILCGPGLQVRAARAHPHDRVYHAAGRRRLCPQPGRGNGGREYSEGGRNQGTTLLYYRRLAQSHICVITAEPQVPRQGDPVAVGPRTSGAHRCEAQAEPARRGGGRLPCTTAVAALCLQHVHHCWHANIIND